MKKKKENGKQKERDVYQRPFNLIGGFQSIDHHIHSECISQVGNGMKRPNKKEDGKKKRKR